MKHMFSIGRNPMVALLCGLMALPLAGLSACNLENVPQALVIRANRVPDTGCVLNAGAAGGKIRLKGTMDLSIGRSYTAYLAIENRFRELEELTSFDDEDARLDGAAVSFQALEIVHTLPADVLSDAGFQAGLTALNVAAPGSTFTVPVSGFAAPDESALVVADIIPANLGQALRGFSGFALGVDAEMVLQLTVSGIRGDGTVVKSAPFFYPIRLCNNCLVAADKLQSTIEAPGVDDLKSTEIFAYGEVCAIGADVPVSNMFCAAFRPGSAGADDFKFNRCLGATSGTLQCQSDGQELTAPIVID